jgi:hypothetical protein
MNEGVKMVTAVQNFEGRIVVLQKEPRQEDWLFLKFHCQSDVKFSI